MHRSQIMLEETHYRFLVDEAQRTGQSISSILRELIDRRMQSQRQPSLERDPLWDMVGIARGGSGKISEDHDRYLADIRLKRQSSRTRRK